MTEVRSFSTGGGGGTSTEGGITGVSEISSVSEEVCAGNLGEEGVSCLGTGGTGGGGAESDALAGNLKFLLIVPFRTRPGLLSSPDSDSLPLCSSGVEIGRAHV